MENKQLNASQKIQKTSQEVNDVKNGVKDGISAVKNYKTGNYVQAAKDAVKVLKNKELRKHVIISSIAGILIPILILLLIAGGFMVVINGIGDRVTSVVSTMGQFISGTGNWFASLFDSDSGKLIININEEKFDELKNNLRSQGINPEASNLTDECLKLFLLAQYHTQYPEDVIIKIEVSDQEKQKIEKRGRGNKLVSENGKNYLKAEGCIKLKRPEFASGNLKYVEKETLDKYVSGEKSFDDVKGKYSISSSGNIIIPERTIEKYIEGEDELQPEMLDFNQEDDFNWDNFNTRRPTEENETPSLKEIPYQSVISSYTMPFEFLTLLTTFTQNSEYGVAVAELVNSKSNIKLNILDNSKTTEERYTYQYMSHSTIHYRVGAEIKTIGPGAWGRTGTASEPYNGNLDEFVSEEKRWNPEIQNYEIFKPHVYRENTIKTEYTSSIQLEEAETWLLKKNSSYNTEEIEPHLDENIENNPQISDVAPRERIKASIDPNQYESLQDVYDSNEDFKNFVDKYYNRDTGKNGINDLRRDLLDGYDRSTMDSFVDEDIEEDLMRKFYEQELHLPYPSDASIFPLPENLRQAYENLLRIIEDYKSRSNNWKIDNNSYDVMPTFISNMMENQQKKTAFYVSEKKYNVTNAGEAEDNTNAFIELLVKSVGNQKKYVYYNTESGGEKAPVLEMLSGPDMLFDLIASNQKTANMENLMRFILYKISGKDFGVTEFESALTSLSSRSVAGEYDVTDRGIFIESKDKLITAINSLGLGTQATNNLVNNADGFIQMQNTYHINAAFAVSVTIVESSAGTAWAAIDSSTYNWYSIKGSHNGQSLNGWRKYTSFNDATMDFGDLIANSDYYVKAGKRTVSEIAPTYCDEQWGNMVKPYMKKLLEAAGVDLSRYSSGGTGVAAEAVEYALSLNGKRLRELTSSFGADWCVWFVRECFSHAGLDASDFYDNYRVSTQAALRYAREGKFKKRGEGYIPQCGDIFVEGTEGNLYHTGMVVDCDGYNIHTIEGNSGYSEGATYWGNSFVKESNYRTIDSASIYGFFVVGEIFK